MPAKTISNRLNAFAIIALMLSGVMAFACAVNAEVYSWADESGSVHFTDDPMGIPRKFKDKAKVREDASNNRSWEYLASDSGADFYYDTINISYLNRNKYRLNVKESYAYAGREEYEMQIILDCARQLYKPTQSTSIYKNQRSPVEMRGSGEEDNQWRMQDGFRRVTYPFQILSRIVCKDSPR